MKTNNVLQFPKEKIARQRRRDRVGQQKAVLALSILSVLILTVLSNQWITRPETSQGNGRTIASIGPMDGGGANVRWEHELANQLSKSQGLAAHLGVKPSLRDELVFGALEGRYGVRMKEGRVETIEFAARDGEQPLVLKDRGAFLTKFGSVFAVSYVDAGLAEKSDSEEVWNLMSEDRTIVGRAVFRLDQQGRVSALSLNR